MFDSLQFILFIIVIISVFLKVVAYGLYEIKQEVSTHQAKLEQLGESL